MDFRVQKATCPKASSLVLLVLVSNLKEKKTWHAFFSFPGSPHQLTNESNFEEGHIVAFFDSLVVTMKLMECPRLHYEQVEKAASEMKPVYVDGPPSTIKINTERCAMITIKGQRAWNISTSPRHRSSMQKKKREE